MNILMITATYPPSVNGVALTTERTVSALRRLGHRVGVIGPQHKGEIESTDYAALPTLRYIPGLPRDYPIGFPFRTDPVSQLIRSTAWDIVHVHHVSAYAAYALKLAKKLGIPCILTYHTQYDLYINVHARFMPARLRKWLFEASVATHLRKMDAVVATTPAIAAQIQGFGIASDRISVIPTAGLDHSFHLDDDPKDLRHTLDLPCDEPVFVTVSRLSREKNVELVIRGFLAWRAQRSSGTLLIIGDGIDRERLLSIIKNQDATHSIRYLGKKPNTDLPMYLSACDAFLYASVTDTISVNLVEAMSAGLPVIAVRDPSTEQVVTNGISGLLIDASPAAFSQAIDRVLDRTFHDQLSSEGMRVSKSYTLDLLVEQLVMLYQRLSFKNHDQALKDRVQ